MPPEMSEWRFLLDENIDPKTATYLEKEEIYMWSRRNTTSFTWIRAVTAAIPERFCSKTAYILVSAHWLRP